MIKHTTQATTASADFTPEQDSYCDNVFLDEIGELIDKGLNPEHALTVRSHNLEVVCLTAHITHHGQRAWCLVKNDGSTIVTKDDPGITALYLGIVPSTEILRASAQDLARGASLAALQRGAEKAHEQWRAARAAKHEERIRQAHQARAWGVTRNAERQTLLQACPKNLGQGFWEHVYQIACVSTSSARFLLNSNDSLDGRHFGQFNQQRLLACLAVLKDGKASSADEAISLMNEREEKTKKAKRAKKSKKGKEVQKMATLIQGAINQGMPLEGAIGLASLTFGEDNETVRKVWEAHLDASQEEA